MQRGTLSFRITLVMVVAFVLLQGAVVLLTGLSGQMQSGGGIGLPDAARMRRMIALVEALPPDQRRDVAGAFDGAFYHVMVDEGALPPTVHSVQGMDIGRAYSAAIPGRAMAVTGQVARFPSIARLNPWPGWWRRDPLTLHIALRGDRPMMLTIESQPSEPVRALLRQRAIMLGLGGLVALGALVLAVRATTRPLVRLAHDMRIFGGEPGSPDLQVTGSRELRDVAGAYNAMKGRIADLVADRTRILAAVAHDMRTYITRLRLRAEFIDDAHQRDRAVADLDEMALLLDDTLLFARTQAKADGGAQRSDLASEMRRLADLHREMGDDVTVAVAVDSASVNAAPVAIRRILGNLVDNGLRHAGAVHGTLSRDGDRWRIDMVDNGPGVAAGQIAQLGRPFGRIDPSRDRATGGAGLGLAIVCGLASAQGGDVAFANRPEGGLMVSLWLPAAP